VYVQELIDEDISTNIQMLPVDEAEALCNRLAQNFNMAEFTTSYSSSSTTTTTTDERKGKDLSSGVVRVVTVAGWNCPCGGTHVRSTGELKERGWGVKGLKCKKGVVRVRYGPNDDDGAGAN
jgi:Ser-tRNA(Ala) deacylase AlaX